MWPWQNIGDVQAFQVTVENDGSSDQPLFLAHIAEQGITVSDGSGAIFTQPPLGANAAGSAV